MAHAALFALAVVLATDDSRPARFESPTVIDTTELTDNADDPESLPGGGGAPAAGAESVVAKISRRARRQLPIETSSAPEPTEPAEPDEASGPEVRVGSVVGDLGGAIGGRGGLGGLDGIGRGRGGAGGNADVAGPRSRVARRVKAPSKARPAVLIWPKRTRKIDSSRLFVIAVTVDEHGYVAGARLVRGLDPHLDHKAMDAIWRFRYRPALDDDGRPTRSALDQRFMLRW